MLELHKGLLPCSREHNSTLPSSANRADQACHLLAHSDMARDSCNHTAPGSLQESPSPCTSSSPFCPARKKRPWSKLEESTSWKKSSCQDCQNSPWCNGSAEIQLIPGSETLGKSSRGKDMDTEWVVNNCERFVNSDVEQLFFCVTHQCGSHHHAPVVRLGSCKPLFLLLSLAAILTEHSFHYFPYNYSLFESIKLVMNDQKNTAEKRRERWFVLSGLWSSLANCLGAQSQLSESNPSVISHPSPPSSSLRHPQLGQASGVGLQG